MWRMSKNSEKPLVMMPLSKKPSNLNTMFSSPLPTSAYCAYLLNKDFSPLNHHLSSGNEKSKSGSNMYAEEVSIGGGRWTPTPEQIHALDEIYRSGTRSPSATQIQQIASRLRRFGKIEGKNVFYWFQNHKARERQKRRRQQLPNDLSLSHQHLHGLITDFEVGKAKKWVTPSDCSTISEESVVSLAITEAEKGEMDEKIQVADNSLQLKIGTSNQQCEVMKFSTVSNIYEVDNAKKHKKLSMQYEDMKYVKDEHNYQKLELFPDWNCNHDDHYQTSDAPKIDDSSEVGTIDNSTKFTPTHFFEFFPLTN